MMEDLSLHILDIAENAMAAGATRIRITIREDEARNGLLVRVADNGRGMSRREVRRALDPFYTTKRKRVGLGLPLLAQAAEHCGGGLTIASIPGKGTKIEARFRFRHVDLPPLTRMATAVTMLLAGHSDIAFFYSHRVDRTVFKFDSRAFLPPGQPPHSLDPDALLRIKKHLQRGLKVVGRT